jgi:hypothetical protein
MISIRPVRDDLATVVGSSLGDRVLVDPVAASTTAPPAAVVRSAVSPD